MTLETETGFSDEGKWKISKVGLEEQFCQTWNKIREGQTYCYSDIRVDVYGRWTLFHEFLKKNIKIKQGVDIIPGLVSYDGRPKTTQPQILTAPSTNKIEEDDSNR
jgi:hypothetical protein